MFWPYLSVPLGLILMIIQMVPMVIREWQTGAAVQVSETEERLT
jgi:TRAP-type C4-dicarboxylate transport system permease small subunit